MCKWIEVSVTQSAGLQQMKLVLKPAQSFLIFGWDGQLSADKTRTWSPLGRIPRTPGLRGRGEFLASAKLLIPRLVLFRSLWISWVPSELRQEDVSKWESMHSDGAFHGGRSPPALELPPLIPDRSSPSCGATLAAPRWPALSRDLCTSFPSWDTACLQSGHSRRHFHIYSVN